MAILWPAIVTDLGMAIIKNTHPVVNKNPRPIKAEGFRYYYTLL
jgi:hypothetical protein